VRGCRILKTDQYTMQLFCLLSDNFCQCFFIRPNSKRVSSLQYTEEMQNMISKFCSLSGNFCLCCFISPSSKRVCYSTLKRCEIWISKRDVWNAKFSYQWIFKPHPTENEHHFTLISRYQHLCVDVRGSKFLWIIGEYVPNHVASHHRRLIFPFVLLLL